MDALAVHTPARVPQMDELAVHTPARVPQMDELAVHTPARVPQMDELANAFGILDNTPRTVARAETRTYPATGSPAPPPGYLRIEEIRIALKRCLKAVLA